MLLRIAIVSFLLAGVSFADEPPKPGTFYKHGQLGIKKMVVEGTHINMTFKPVDEQFFWCPGIKVQTTDKATIVTFVRCRTSMSCGIDTKAAIKKRLIRTVKFDTKGKDTYIRNGAKQFKKIYVGKKSASGTKKAASTKTKPKSVGSGTKPKSAGSGTKQKSAQNRKWISNAFARPLED